MEKEQKVRKDLLDLSEKTGVALVATNDTHYISSEDAKAHEVLMCIGDGKTIYDSTRTVFEAKNYHLSSAEEMWNLFGSELPESLRNTLKIAECAGSKFPENNLELPIFDTAGNKCTTTDEFSERSSCRVRSAPKKRREPFMPKKK